MSIVFATYFVGRGFSPASETQPHQSDRDSTLNNSINVIWGKVLNNVTVINLFPSRLKHAVKWLQFAVLYTIEPEYQAE